MVQRIKLTTTTGYFKTVIPVVSNATIFITNSSNIKFTYGDSHNGEYICTNFNPVINEVYVLTVVHNGPIPPKIEISLPKKQNNEGGFQQNNEIKRV
jgi:hypothetical protein